MSLIMTLIVMNYYVKVRANVCEDREPSRKLSKQAWRFQCRPQPLYPEKMSALREDLNWHGRLRSLESKTEKIYRLKFLENLTMTSRSVWTVL